MKKHFYPTKLRITSPPPYLTQSTKISIPNFALPIVRKPSFQAGNRSEISKIAPLTRALSNVARCGTSQKLGKDASSPLAPLQNHSEIKIRIFSNWGHPSLVSCSKLEILSSNNSSLPIRKISILPAKHETNELDKLINGTLIKDDESHLWTMKWPPEPPLKSVELVLDVVSAIPIQSIRIWPNSQDLTQNIKHVIVIFNHVIFYKGELPKDFGMIIPLKFFDDEGNSIINRLEVEKQSVESDKWGVLPFRASTRIEILCTHSYLSNSHFGLQQIMLFDQEGNWYDVEANTLVEEFDCGEVERSAKTLFFDPNERLPVGQRRQLWKGELTGKSRIAISFPEPILISAVAIVTLKPVPGPIDIGLKQATILSDNVKVWTGKLKHGNPEHGDNRECMNVVFLYDNEKVREKVITFCYPPILEFLPKD